MSATANVPADLTNPPATPEHHDHPQSFWLWIMCLTGVDYFSTLGYQPSIAFDAAGLLAPLATVVLVLVTLFGALPVYSYVANESFRGQGSIAMLERLVHGWTGKFLVLVLLGFAATDFVITKTLSAADAAAHLIHNPYWEAMPWFMQATQGQIIITMVLLVGLGAMFLRGFKEVIGLAVVIVAVYLVLNAIVIGSGVGYLFSHPELISHWWAEVQAGPDHWHMEHAPIVTSTSLFGLFAVSVILFPKLALGLSGFETGVAVMPLVQGDPTDNPQHPKGRIRNTRKLLLVAAVIMSVFLIGSSMVTAMVIDPVALGHDGAARDRAMAYLAHGQALEQTGPHAIDSWFHSLTGLRLFGDGFGTLYDLSTVIILWFAGASAMSGLLNLVPRYLPSYGMAPEWARAIRPLAIMFTIINLTVTLIFQADVEAQGGAYATGVMVLITSAATAASIDRYRKAVGSWWWRMPWGYVLIAIVFVYSTIDIVIEKPDGLKIASCFIAAVVVASMVSRTLRSTELRFLHFEYANNESHFLWDTLKHLEFPVLVPHRPGRQTLESKEAQIRQVHRLGADVPIVFVESVLGDTSEFYQSPLMEIRQEEGRFIIRVTRCVSIAHVVATIALELSKLGKPPEIHFGWSDESPMAANLRFVLFGEGNVPWMVRELIRLAEPNPDKRPPVIIG
ncbi:MAG TPA: hypothetical protein VL096_14660 [Pirellulaceae bacterium]|nr:hypothetical protein [Pirellulaceae bacterium]